MSRSKSARLEKNGYYIIYKPEHPRSFKTKSLRGYMYEHIFIAEIDYGRSLRDDEDVHHLDLNKFNNSPENLVILPARSHGRLHHWMTFNKIIPIQKIVKRCEVCDFPLKVSEQEQFCSIDCLKNGRVSVIDSIGITQIKKDIKELKSIVKVGAKYNLSDNSIRKWLKKKFNLTNKQINDLKNN